MSSRNEESSSLDDEHPIMTNSMLDDANLLNESIAVDNSFSSEISSDSSQSSTDEPSEYDSNDSYISLNEVKEQNNILRSLLHEVRKGGIPQQQQFHFSACDDDLSGPLSDTHYNFTVAAEKNPDPIPEENDHQVLSALDNAIESSRLTDMDSLSASPSLSLGEETWKNPLNLSVLNEEVGDYTKSVFVKAEDSMMECEESSKEDEEKEKEACVKEEEWRMSDLSDSVIVSDESEEEMVEIKKSEEKACESEEKACESEEVAKKKSEEIVYESEEEVAKKKSEEIVYESDEKMSEEELGGESEISSSLSSREGSQERESEENKESNLQEEPRSEEGVLSPFIPISHDSEEKSSETPEEEKSSETASEDCIDLITDSSSNASPAPIPPAMPSPELPLPDLTTPEEEQQTPPFYNDDAFKPRFSMEQINQTLSVFNTVSTKRSSVVSTEAEQANEEVENKLKQCR